MKFGVFFNPRLDEKRRELRIEPAGDQRRGHFPRLAAQRLGVLPDRDRVQVHDAIDRLVLVLQRHPVADGAEVVAEGGHARRLDAGKDAGHRERHRFQ